MNDRNFHTEVAANLDFDIDLYGLHAIRFIAGIYEKVCFYWGTDDIDKIYEIVCSFISFVDGLAPDTRAFVQPCLGFIKDPANFVEDPPSVILPFHCRSSIHDWVGGVITELHENPNLYDSPYSMMPEEQLLALRKTAIGY